jgi:hypothetical protein
MITNALKGCPLFLIFFVSCEKILPAPELARPIHIEIHVQVIDAVVVLEIDGEEVTIDGRGKHLVKALVFSGARRMRVVLMYGKKATIAIHDYVGGRLYEPGEIKGGESFGF